MTPKPGTSPVTDEIIGAFRKVWPHGHADFLPITLRELQLHSDKNHDYAAGGKPTGNFDRVAAILALYPKLQLSDPRVVALVYAMKQLDAVLWGLSNNIQAKVEGLNERLQDISVYSKIVMCMNADVERLKEENPVLDLCSKQNSMTGSFCGRAEGHEGKHERAHPSGTWEVWE